MKDGKVKKRGLGANFIYNFISQVLALIVPLITTPYLSRVLRETGNGQYSYALSIITYFILFANLGFDIYGQRQIAAYQDDKERKSAAFWEITALKGIFTAVSLGVLYAVLFTAGFGESYTPLILILSVQVVIVPLDVQFLFRGDEDFRAIALRTIVLRVITLACIFIFVRRSTDTWLYCLCVSLSAAFSNIVMWPSVFKRVSCVPLRELKLARHLKPAFLIFLPTLAVTVYSVLDKTMIGLLAENPDYQNGCYEQAYKINSVALLLVTLISSVMVSRNAHEHGAGNAEGVKNNIYFAARYVWLMGLPLIVGFAVLSPNLCSWFLGEGYAEVPLLLMIMSVRFVVSGLGVVLGDQLFIATGREKYPTIATACAAVLNFGLNFWLIPYFGAVGAAITTAVAEVAVTAVLCICAAATRSVSVLKIFVSCWKYLLAAAVMFVPVYFMQKYMPYEIWSFAAITLTGAIVYGVMLIVLRDGLTLKVLKRLSEKLSARRAGEDKSPDEQGEDNV